MHGYRGVIDDPANVERLRSLIGMLGYRRPMGSRTERKFRSRYLLDLPGVVQDQYRNLHCTIDRADGSASRVLWSSHTDTVHRDGGMQAIEVGDRLLYLADRKASNCLGADDTVGVWIMREMMLARVPGHYVFHHGEERGGIGSSSVVRHQPDRFAGLDYAIAFDRRGTRDVITHQAYGRTASDAFAKSLCKLLRGAGRYRPSAKGIYTDTAEYAEIIAECTNVSVGYHFEHTAYEQVEYWHALRLLRVLLRFDESKLVCARDPYAFDDDEYLDARDLRWFNDRRWPAPTVTATKRSPYERQPLFGDRWRFDHTLQCWIDQYDGEVINVDGSDDERRAAGDSGADDYYGRFSWDRPIWRKD